MRAHALDTFTRFVMLVLAGLVSLSILGTIAAIPSGSIESRIGWDEPAPPAGPRDPAPRSPAPDRTGAEGTNPAPDGTVPGTAGAPGAGFVATPAQPEPADAARWLEAITYALVALIGIFAIGLILLARAAADLRRLADARAP